MSGYEIHMGETVLADSPNAMPMNHIRTADGMQPEGCMVSVNCMGTYIHGILDNPSFINCLIGQSGEVYNDIPQDDYQTIREQQYDRLAAHVRQHVDMEKIYEILKSDR